MNGESAFGWLKVVAVLVGAFFLYALAKKFFDFFTVGAGYNNPAKRGVDSVVSAVTGREETLGGWLNEILDPNAKKVAALSKPLTMTAPSTSNYVPFEDNYVDETSLSKAPLSVRLDEKLRSLFGGT